MEKLGFYSKGDGGRVGSEVETLHICRNQFQHKERI